MQNAKLQWACSKPMTSRIDKKDSKIEVRNKIKQKKANYLLPFLFAFALAIYPLLSMKYRYPSCFEIFSDPTFAFLPRGFVFIGALQAYPSLPTK